MSTSLVRPSFKSTRGETFENDPTERIYGKLAKDSLSLFIKFHLLGGFILCSESINLKSFHCEVGFSGLCLNHSMQKISIKIENNVKCGYYVISLLKSILCFNNWWKIKMKHFLSNVLSMQKVFLKGFLFLSSKLSFDNVFLIVKKRKVFEEKKFSSRVQTDLMNAFAGKNTIFKRLIEWSLLLLESQKQKKNSH